MTEQTSRQTGATQLKTFASELTYLLLSHRPTDDLSHPPPSLPQLFSFDLSFTRVQRNPTKFGQNRAGGGGRGEGGSEVKGKLVALFRSQRSDLAATVPCS